MKDMRKVLTYLGIKINHDLTTGITKLKPKNLFDYIASQVWNGRL